jgi:hypothetical protein
MVDNKNQEEMRAVTGMREAQVYAPALGIVDFNQCRS